MVDDFNIRDSDWNPSYSFHSSYSNILVEIVDSFDLTLFSAIQQVPTQYFDNENYSNSVINLLFLQLNSVELNNYKIYPQLHFLSDHTSLAMNIIIEEKFIPKKKHTIVKNNEEESEFVEDFIRRFRSFDIVNITDKLSFKTNHIKKS